MSDNVVSSFQMGFNRGKNTAINIIDIFIEIIEQKGDDPAYDVHAAEKFANLLKSVRREVGKIQQ
jgi:hypothetical protein